MIPFFWNWKYPSISLSDVLEWKYQEGYFKDKIVLVWESWTLIHDSYPSPLWRNLDWVEFHANFIDWLLQDISLKQIDIKIYIVLLLILSIIFFLVTLQSTYRSLIVSFVLLSLFFIIFWRLLLNQFHVLLELSLILFFLIFQLLSFSGYKYYITDLKKRYIKQAFKYYISPELVEQLGTDESLLKLGWKEKRLTIFFSDIAWFTTLSEALWTEKLFIVLSEYLTEMTNILRKNQWTLDKYIWDAVMWFYNAPIDIENHAYLACKTALEQQIKINELNQKWNDLWYPSIWVRIWIHTWNAIVWNVGSHEHFNYTVIWDSVNLSSRLEWVNKEYGTKICISESTYQEVKELFICRELDTIKVKWKTQWVKIYELVDFIENETTIISENIKKYTEGLNLYYNEGYKEASSIFKWLQDETSKIMLLRCQEAEKWNIIIKDGVYEMKTK